MAPRVLLVDDEIHILRAAEYKLKHRGYDVLCVLNGEEAWREIQKQRPDVLITDQQMPRLNGTELVERIRRHEAYADIPTILLTAKGFELGSSDTINALGILEVITKPFSPRELCNRIESALKERDKATDSLAL